MDKHSLKSYSLNLSEKGVYPIAYNEEKKLLCDLGFQFPAIPGTIISEGNLIGYKCLYIQLQGCNLRCAWVLPNGNGCLCDSYKVAYDNEYKNILPIWNILKRIYNNLAPGNYVIITGGEPLLQCDDLLQLILELRKEDYKVVLETNATIYNDDIALQTDYFVISPKLYSSIPWEDNLKNTGIEYIKNYALRHNFLRCRQQYIQKYIDICDQSNGNKNYELRIVISSAGDIYEFKTEYLAHLKFVNEKNIVLIPAGNNIEELYLTSEIAIKESIKNNWRFTPRLNQIFIY